MASYPICNEIIRLLTLSHNLYKPKAQLNSVFLEVKHFFSFLPQKLDMPVALFGKLRRQAFLNGRLRSLRGLGPKSQIKCHKQRR